MLIHIKNEPRNYAWGMSNGISRLLGTEPSGRPEAELWLGSHPGSPSQIAKATPVAQSLIELIENDPERYGVNGHHLPFLLKILAIDAPLSLQAHPTRVQAATGFAREEAHGIPLDSPARNYRDSNHKPELVVALEKVTALSGFRSLVDALTDLRMLHNALPVGEGQTSLARGIDLLRHSGTAGQQEFVRWALSGCDEAKRAAAAVSVLARESDALPLAQVRVDSLQRIAAHYPDDPGLLVSILLHLVELEPGESIYLDAGNLHAYLSGLAIEVMAASDNVLRGGMTQKHVDVEELCRVARFNEIDEPRFTPEVLSPGVRVWNPSLPDFRLIEVEVGYSSETHTAGNKANAAPRVTVPAEFPLVLIVTRGQVRVEREEGNVHEIAVLRRGQSIYVSAGEPVSIRGTGQAYLATVGACWGR